MFSPVVTIGGGVVLDWGDRRYRTPAEAAARLGVLASGDPAARIALLVRETEFGATAADLAARTGMTDDAIARAAATGVVTLVQPRPWYVDRPWFDAARARLLAAVRSFHGANPLAGGIARQDLRARELPACPPHVFEALLAAEPGLSVDGETVRVFGHQLALTGEEERARAAIEQAFETAGLEAPAWGDVIAGTGLDTARARRLLEMLVREGRLVRVGADLVFHRSAIERVRSLLAPRRTQRFNVAAFKLWTGISRKYAIPLLEFLDREHVTRREGDQRLVL
jgi:selenocysteine-specific elongation factor